MKDKNFPDDNRRSFIKGIFAAGAAAFLASAISKETQASDASSVPGNDQEILYRETKEFRAYYDSLLD